MPLLLLHMHQKLKTFFCVLCLSYLETSDSPKIFNDTSTATLSSLCSQREIKTRREIVNWCESCCLTFCYLLLSYLVPTLLATGMYFFGIMCFICLFQVQSKRPYWVPYFRKTFAACSFFCLDLVNIDSSSLPGLSTHIFLNSIQSMKDHLGFYAFPVF